MKRVILTVMSVALLSGLLSCAGTRSAAKCERTMKMLLDRQAHESAFALFGAPHNPERSRLVSADEIREFVAEHGIPVEKLPPGVQKAIHGKDSVGLFVPGFDPPVTKEKQERVEKRATRHFVYLSAWDVDFWLTAYNGGGSRGPCNGEFCLNCTGCEGQRSDGTWSVCVCTNSCKFCRDCPTCRQGSGPVP